MLYFHKELNKNDKESLITINGKIEKLYYQLYEGKRVNVKLLIIIII
jgi:hypothetical protein